MVLLSVVCASAQVGIGTTNPTESSILDITSTDKGVLLPRISLNGTNDVSTISMPAIGLLIYNTATTSDVVPGFYYWDNSQWVKFSTSDMVREGWNLDGNNLNSEPNPVFIGTTSYDPFVQKVNNQEMGRLDPNGSTVFGFGAYSTANNAIVMGRNAMANGQNSVTLGYEASTTSNDAISIGYQSDASGYQSLAFGYQSTATQNSSSAIGYKALASGYLSTSLGVGTEASGQESLAIGVSSNPSSSVKTISSGYQSLAIGRNARSTGASAISVGNTSSAINTNTIAIGNNAIASGVNSVAIGRNANASNSNTIILGDNTGNINVGIGTSSPQTNLHIKGSLRIDDGNQGEGRILQSDVQGNATWVVPNYIKSFSDAAINGNIVNSSGATTAGGGVIALNSSSFVSNGISLSANKMYVNVSRSGYYRLSYSLIINIDDDNDAENETIQLFFSKSANGSPINRTITKLTLDGSLHDDDQFTLTTTAIVHLDPWENIYYRIINPAGGDISLVVNGSGATIESVYYD